jgi:nitrogen-specific signal transduction histidine kinase
MFTALVSMLKNVRIRHDVAMTGEITLRGRVLPVGGIKEKVLAAHRAGITHVLLPLRNAKDIEDIPEEDLRQEIVVDQIEELVARMPFRPNEGGTRWVIVREADRLQTLVDRLLAPHRRPHVVSDVNIHEVCERVRSLILAEFPRGLRVQRDYDTSLPEFRGDFEQLIQAVLNIAHNAALALTDRITQGDAIITLRTRVARQITVSKQRFRLALELHVIDNGPGVPESLKDRLFSPLVSGRDGGSGLGLNLAQTFVQQHQGLIECDSVPGLTDFKIVIPLP